MKTTIRIIALTLALALSGAALSPAIASAQEQSATVTYKDLDLTTEEGREALEQRIDRAARQVCELEGFQTGTRIRDRDARRCYEEARRNIEERFASIVREARLGG